MKNGKPRFYAKSPTGTRRTSFIVPVTYSVCWLLIVKTANQSLNQCSLIEGASPQGILKGIPPNDLQCNLNYVFGCVCVCFVPYRFTLRIPPMKLHTWRKLLKWPKRVRKYNLICTAYNQCIKSTLWFKSNDVIMYSWYSWYISLFIQWNT